MTADESFNTAAQVLDEALLQEAASKSPDLLKMKQLIDDGANVNASASASDKQRYSVLMVAINHNNPAAAALLLDNGADKYARSADGKFDTMALAIAHYNLDSVRVLLDQGYDPNRERCHSSLRPIMMAMHLKQLLIGEELVRRGADIHAKNPEDGNRTAMDYAENNNKPHMAKRLLEIDDDNKERARRESEEEKIRAAQERVAVAQRELDAICNAGLPTGRNVKAMKPLSLRPRVA